MQGDFQSFGVQKPVVNATVKDPKGFSLDEVEAKCNEFDNLFKNLYEEQIIDNLFNDPAIIMFNKDEFVSNVAPSALGQMFGALNVGLDIFDEEEENEAEIKLDFVKEGDL